VIRLREHTAVIALEDVYARTGSQDALQFQQRTRAVREVLEHEADKRSVEGGIVERERSDVADLKFDIPMIGKTLLCDVD
jgi:hypothetical protein